MVQIIKYIQLSVIGLCLYLVYLISEATLNGINFIQSPLLMKIQLWICIYFIAAFVAEFFLSKDKKWRYLKTHLFFLIVSIPYISVIEWLKLPIDIYSTGTAATFLKYIPLIRGGYALAIVVGWITSNKISSFLITYLMILISGIYFGALLFYEIEGNINPMIHTFWNAAWWSMMNATTVGSNIYAITIPGQILSTIIAATGMMMFPIFTVYITNLVAKFGKESKQSDK